MSNRFLRRVERAAMATVFQDAVPVLRQYLLKQDKQAMERQAIGLRYKPPLMLVDEADTLIKWYYKLKTAHLAAVQTGRPLDHPLKGPVTLRWRS